MLSFLFAMYPLLQLKVTTLFVCARFLCWFRWFVALQTGYFIIFYTEISIHLSSTSDGSVTGALNNHCLWSWWKDMSNPLIIKIVGAFQAAHNTMSTPRVSCFFFFLNKQRINTQLSRRHHLILRYIIEYTDLWVELKQKPNKFFKKIELLWNWNTFGGKKLKLK